MMKANWIIGDDDAGTQSANQMQAEQASSIDAPEKGVLAQA